MNAQRHPLARPRRNNDVQKKGRRGWREEVEMEASHVLESSDFPLVVELVIEVALDVGVHGDDKGGPHGPSSFSDMFRQT